MPTSPTEKEIVSARRENLRRWISDHFGGSQADYIRDAANRGERIDQSELSRLLVDKSFGEKKARKLESQSLMPAGYLVHPLQTNKDRASKASPLVSRERYAEGDAIALQIGLEGLVTVLLRRVPESAAAFEEYVEKRAAEHDFSAKRGLLGRLVRNARTVRQSEEAAAQVLRRAGPAARTKRGK